MEGTLVDYIWIITASALVFFMQPGFAMLESGLTRSKNSINVAIKNLTDVGVSMLAFWAVGFALMFGASRLGLVGLNGFLLQFSGKSAVWIAVFFMFQAMFCSTSATIVSGAVAERMRYSSYLICTLMLSVIIYPVFGHWAWGGLGNMEWDVAPGWLAAIGFVDFAGSSVVHSVGGWTALAAVLIIGNRSGRFPEGQKPKAIPGSNIPLSVLGVFVLWFGWMGFNGGSTLAMNQDVPGIIMRTCLAAASGMIFALAAGWFFYKRPDISFVINGSLAGLVAITAPAHAVNEWQSLLIGGIGGLVALAATELLERARIDDAVGAIPVHLAAGIWGTLSVGIFGDEAILGGAPILGSRLLAQTIGVIACGVWSFGSAWLVFKLINRISPLRVSKEHESAGLNISEHGASTELYELFSVMTTQSQTGDLSLRLPVEPFTEVGQIAAHYNRAMDGFQQNLVARTDYQAILDSVSDGLFLLDTDMRIHPHYSQATEKIFGRANLSAVDFRDLIQPMLPQKIYESTLEYLRLLFDGKVKAKSLAQVNPLKEAEFYIDTGDGRFESRYLRLDASRIFGPSGIDKLMIVVSDLSAQVLARKETELEKKRSQGEMELFYKILHIDPELFSEFMDGMREDLDDMNNALEHEGTGYPELLERLFRRAHSVKGNASLLELDFIAQSAHEFEDQIALLQMQSELSSVDFLPLAVSLSNLYGLLSQTERLSERLASFRTAFVAGASSDGELLALQIKRLVDAVSKDLGKKVQLDYERFSTRDIPRRDRKRVRDILVQLVRNSLAHGIEEPERRSASGKTPEGKLVLMSRKSKDCLSLILRDDGGGIDFQALGAALRLPADTPKNRILEEVLSQQISTANTETRGLHAGRGVGLGLVKSLVQELRGSLLVRTRKGAFCEFEIQLPLSAAAVI